MMIGFCVLCCILIVEVFWLVSGGGVGSVGVLVILGSWRLLEGLYWMIWGGGCVVVVIFEIGICILVFVCVGYCFWGWEVIK